MKGWALPQGVPESHGALQGILSPCIFGEKLPSETRKGRDRKVPFLLPKESYEAHKKRSLAAPLINLGDLLGRRVSKGSGVCRQIGLEIFSRWGLSHHFQVLFLVFLEHGLEGKVHALKVPAVGFARRQCNDLLKSGGPIFQVFHPRKMFNRGVAVVHCQPFAGKGGNS